MAKKAFVRRIALMAGTLMLAFNAGAAHAIDLGQALNFSVLSLDKSVVLGTGSAVGGAGAIGGQSILLRADSSAAGDLIASPLGILMKAGTSAGNCITGGKPVKLDPSASCTADTSGTNPELTMLSQAITDVGTYVAAIKAKTPTKTLPRIKVAANDTQQISVSGGLNVIVTPSVTLKAGSTLQFLGGAGDTAILIVNGNLTIGKDTLLAPAIQNSQLLETHFMILVLGRIVTLGKNSILNATIIAPKATCTLGTGLASRGAYLCGKSVVLQNQDAQGDSGAILFEPTEITL